MGDTDDGSDGAFPRALAELKREGANVLVVGAVPHGIHVRASERLLGTADGSTRRRRVLALVGVNPATAARRLPAGAPPDRDHLRVVVQDLPVRSAGPEERDAAADGPGATTGDADPDGDGVDGGSADDGAPDVPVTTVPDDDLGEVGATIADAIADLDRAAGGLEPAELRLGLDSVSALLGIYDRSSVLVFLHLVAERVAAVDGVGHYHLPVDRDEEVVSTLLPLFDATVELRLGADGAEQRWHLQDGVSSEWLPLDPDG